MSAGPSGNSASQATFIIELLVRQLQVALLFPRRLGAPVGSAGLVGNWDPPSMGRPAQRVPVPGANVFLHRPHIAVWFMSLREGSASKGIHLADLFRLPSEPETLDGAEDIVLSGIGGPRRELKLLIDWPGYEPERTMISTVSADGGPLTRRTLARNIMIAYGNFFRKVAKERILPCRVGFYNIALHQGSDARSDSLGIQLWQLYLVKFREPVPGDDHWVAEIDIVPA
ncbi:hypothetical protein V8E55_003356 [Tylopilus felleus]